MNNYVNHFSPVNELITVSGLLGYYVTYGQLQNIFSRKSISSCIISTLFSYLQFSQTIEIIDLIAL